MKYFDDEWMDDATTEYEPDEAIAGEDAGDKLHGHAKRTKAYLSAVLGAVILLLLGTGAWYVISSQRDIDTVKTEVMTPYFLYLLNPHDLKSLQPTIGNIHPGEIKREVICVSNQKPDAASNREISRDSNFLYELELAYTENLAVNYEVYQLEPDDEGDVLVTDDTGGTITTLASFSKKYAAPMDSTDVSATRRREVYNVSMNGIVNLGRYDSYTEGGAGEKGGRQVLKG